MFDRYCQLQAFVPRADDLATNALAVKVLDAYASKIDGLMPSDCDYLQAEDEFGYLMPEDQYVEPFQCDILQDVLGRGSDSGVTKEEMGLLSDAGFSRAFIETLTGGDGRQASYLRAERLSNFIISGIVGIDGREAFVKYNETVAALDGLSLIGAEAWMEIPNLVYAIGRSDKSSWVGDPQAELPDRPKEDSRAIKVDMSTIKGSADYYLHHLGPLMLRHKDAQGVVNISEALNFAIVIAAGRIAEAKVKEGMSIQSFTSQDFQVASESPRDGG